MEGGEEASQEGEAAMNHTDRYAVIQGGPYRVRRDRPRGREGLRVAPLAILTALALVLGLILAGSTAQARHFAPPVLVNLGEPVNDHYVTNGTFADTNFAQGFVLWGTGSGTTIRRGFIEWDVTALPEGAIVQSASFAVQQTSSPSVATTLLFCEVTSSWAEASITFNTQPTVGSCPITYSAELVGGLKNITLPNAFVQGWFDSPSTNFGFRLNLTDESAAVFGSQAGGFEGKEASDAHPGDSTPSPTLYVTFTLSPTQEEVAIGVLIAIAVAVVALGFFVLVAKRRRTLDDLLVFLMLLFIFVVVAGVATVLFFSGG